jgi:hypothetical protein
MLTSAFRASSRQEQQGVVEGMCRDDAAIGAELVDHTLIVVVETAIVAQLLRSGPLMPNTRMTLPSRHDFTKESIIEASANANSQNERRMIGARRKRRHGAVTTTLPVA